MQIINLTGTHTMVTGRDLVGDSTFLAITIAVMEVEEGVDATEVGTQTGETQTAEDAEMGGMEWVVVTVN